MKPEFRPFAVSALALAAAIALPSAGQAQMFNLDGSFGEGGFARYVPPVTNPTLNETPFITSEAKPIYIYHDIPNDFFITDGGSVNVVALQARLAITDRLGFIATTDGYSWVKLKGGPDDSGFNDITAGLKYALVSDPAAGTIVSVGARYTAPLGNISLDGLDLTGVGSGFVDLFLSAAQLGEKSQVQGSLGLQMALSNDNWSYIHGSLHADYELFPNFFPLVEVNAIVPIDGGNQIDGVNLTGAEILDLGASDPENVLTVGIGARYRFSDNMILGAAIEQNLLSNKVEVDGSPIPGTEASVWNWRITTDLTIHF